MRSFFSEFKSSIDPKRKSGPRLDDWQYLISWPIVYFLNKTPATPNHVGLTSFVSGLCFLVGLLYFDLQSQYLILAIILFIRIILDCADGQLARYSGQTSNLGALYDLTSDFIFAVGLFIVIAVYLVIKSGTAVDMALPTVFISFCSFVITATVHSYLVKLDNTEELSETEIKRLFVSKLPNDRPESTTYSSKLRILNSLFHLTWKPVSFIVVNILVNNTHRENLTYPLHLLSFTEYGMHLTALFLVLLLQLPIVYFLIYELFLLCYTVVILLLMVNRSGFEK